MNVFTWPFKMLAKASAAEPVTKTATYGGATASIYFGLTLNEIGVIVGIVIGIAGFVAGQYWKWREACWRERSSFRSPE